jgi:3-hydroxyisobutyrate dehydrogenase-like beta-hydroxyacid dehydrogenase
MEVAPMAKIAWLGSGTMGFPAAGNLSQRATPELIVFNRTTYKSDYWISE